jgi:hypothetical protein
MRDLQALYGQIVARGYHIDVREVRPILVRSLWARSFATWEEALDFALQAPRDHPNHERTPND